MFRHVSHPHLVAVPLLVVLLVGFAPLRAAPPKVVSVRPADGDFAVDPQADEIRIEFDQDMNHGGHSVCGGGEYFPKLLGQPRWESARVFVMKVRLEPNHDYGFSVNCSTARNFRSVAGESAEVYPVQFATAGGHSDVSPKKHAASFKELRRLLDDEYSYRDVHKADWDKLFAEYRDRLCGAETPEQFGRYVGRLLAAAKDIHISVKLGDRYFMSHSRSVPPNMNYRKMPELVPHLVQRSQVVYTGRWPEGIGYIAILSWGSRNAEALEPVYHELDEMKDCRGLIIDVRANSGGSESLAQEFAGCFVDKPVVYARHVLRDKSAPGGFTPPIDRVLQPSENRPQYRGKVAVLTGRHVMSSCEAFLLMMKQVSNCTLVGETSYGASGNPRGHELPNGVVVMLPCWKPMTVDGTEFEGVGIPPDIEVKANPEDFAERDPVLEAALEYLRE